MYNKLFCVFLRHEVTFILVFRCHFTQGYIFDGLVSLNEDSLYYIQRCCPETDNMITYHKYKH